jgi:hypothetical protein
VGCYKKEVSSVVSTIEPGPPPSSSPAEGFFVSRHGVIYLEYQRSLFAPGKERLPDEYCTCVFAAISRSA